MAYMGFDSGITEHPGILFAQENSEMAKLGIVTKRHREGVFHRKRGDINQSSVNLISISTLSEIICKSYGNNSNNRSSHT